MDTYKDVVNTERLEAKPTHCIHGGKGFEEVGESFTGLHKLGTFVPADVLDAWYPPSPKVTEVLRSYSEWAAHTSPPVHGAGLKEAIARHRGIDPGQIVLGGGSSDLIFRVLPRFLHENGPVLLPSPVYGEYFHVLKNLYGKRVERFSTEENRFRLDCERLLSAAREVKASAIVMVNPNNPTGTFVTRDEILSLLHRLPQQVKVVIDETYIDYVGAQSLEQEVQNFPQLAILKSMSKVYGLSGLRVGYAVFNERIASELDRFTPPYVVSTFGQMAAIAALEDEAYVEKMLAITRTQRGRMAAQLTGAVGVIEGIANSLILDFKDSEFTALQARSFLEDRKIFTRMIDDQGVQHKSRYLRISVLGSEDNAKLVSALLELRKTKT